MLADRFEAEFTAAGHRVTRTAVRRYPEADALPALLHGLPTTGGVAVVALSPSSPNRAWVLGELRHAELYPAIVAGVSALGEVATCRSSPARVWCPGMPLPFDS
jgi:hypothetical protein